MTTAAALARTPLQDAHASAGARMGEFAGFEMPLTYAGVRREHLAVRERAGAFDVSHMGQIETSGPRAAALLQHLLTNDVDELGPGGSQYSCICAEDGGVLDDAITYRLGEQRFLTVTNAANAAADARRFAARAEAEDAEALDAGDRYAMIAVQGPLARKLIGGLSDDPAPERRRCAPLRVAGAETLACGTGYTGEDGVELLLAPEDAPSAWEALLDAGAEPCGLAARDTLRIEDSLPLYGNELSRVRTPVAAGLGWCCREETGFIGAPAVAAERQSGAAERLAAFALTGRGVPIAGNPVMLGSDQVGEVTSGTHSPTLGVGIGMAYVTAELAEPGTKLEIDVRGTRRAARVQRRPLYKQGRESSSRPERSAA